MPSTPSIQARDALFEKIAPGLDAKPEDLSLKDGQVLVKGEAKMSWKDACRKLGMMPITETGKFERGPLLASASAAASSPTSTVDIETGVVRLKKIVAVQDTGLIIDKLTWESQVYGGVIGGLNYGLFEERVMDPTTGRDAQPRHGAVQARRGVSDIPEIVVKAYETDEMKARGVIGVGEPPTISHRRRDRQRRDQRHRRPRPRMADVPPERPQRPGHGLQRREGVTHESL